MGGGKGKEGNGGKTSKSIGKGTEKGTRNDKGKGSDSREKGKGSVGDSKGKGSFERSKDGERKGGKGSDFGGFDRKGGKDHGKGKGKSSRRDLSNGPYLGILTRVAEGGGFAFVESPVCKEWYGQDVYVFPRIMDENGIAEGDAVAFYVHENEKGQPAMDAFKPIWKLMMPPRENRVPALGQHTGGCVTMTEKGHAYIHSPELKYRHKQDVYVNEKVVVANGLEEGHFVCFDLHINNSGMPQASSPLWLETNKKDWQPPGNRRPREEGEDEAFVSKKRRFNEEELGEELECGE